MPPKIDPNEIRYSKSSSIQSTSRCSEASQALLPLSLPSLVPSDSTLRKLVKTSSKKARHGREFV